MVVLQMNFFDGFIISLPADYEQEVKVTDIITFGDEHVI